MEMAFLLRRFCWVDIDGSYSVLSYLLFLIDICLFFMYLFLFLFLLFCHFDRIVVGTSVVPVYGYVVQLSGGLVASLGAVCSTCNCHRDRR